MLPPSSRRGRTARERLVALDRFVLAHERQTLVAGKGPFLDVGFGDEPLTTLQAAATFRAVAPALVVIGVERDPDRVARARAQAPAPELTCVTGGFDALPSLGPARLIRVMNVLRGYPEAEVAQAHARIGAALEAGGLALEGTSNPEGTLLTAHLLRRQGSALHREALLFFFGASAGFAPLQFRDWLPRDLRRRVRAGEWIHAFFADWTEAWEQTRAAHRDAPAAAFAAAAERLAVRRGGVHGPGALGEGYLLYRPPGGVPA